MFASLCLVAALSTLTADPGPGSIDEQIGKILAGLPGKTAFAFTELEQGQPKLLYGVHADERMAVGSTFKLFILGTLADEVNRGRQRADNTMLLQSKLIGPPSSELAGWPVGSPVTLHTLALKMISISDNTATDHLLYLLGRERIEQQMIVMGHGDPAVNRPLLSTRDMTQLRDKALGLPGREYAKLDDAGKRAYLAAHSQGQPDYDKLDFDTGAYEVAEWYASPLDMARALAWIYDHTQPNQPAHELRAILTVDDKLPHDAQTWPYVGFKGGSEDQLLAGNWLLQHRGGKWYTLHLYYNNPAGPAEEKQFVAALMNIFGLIEGSIK